MTRDFTSTVSQTKSKNRFCYSDIQHSLPVNMTNKTASEEHWEVNWDYSKIYQCFASHFDAIVYKLCVKTTHHYDFQTRSRHIQR